MSARSVFERAFAARDGALVHWGLSVEGIAARGAGLGYFASPISKRFSGAGDADWYVLERLIREAALDCDSLAQAGVTVISPAVMALEMIRARGVSARVSVLGARGVLDRDFWLRWCAPLLRASDFVIVSDRAGWSASDGIAAEVDQALRWNRPVFFMAASLGSEGI